MSYIDKRGKSIEEKKFINIDCNCKSKCIEKLAEEERKNMLDFSWKKGDFSKQNACLCGLVHMMPVKQSRPRDGRKMGRNCSHVYFLQKSDDTAKVSKRLFLNTYGMCSDERLCEL